MRGTKRIVLGPLLGAVLATGLPCPFAGADVIRVETETLPLPLFREAATPAGVPKLDVRIEASAVEPIGDGTRVLLAHDKADELFVVETATGRILGAPVSFEAFPRRAQFGPKWEGMARDEEGFFYVIGSRSGKSEEERAQHSYFFRFRLKGKGTPEEPLAVDQHSVRRWNYVNSLASALARESNQAEQLKIEGLTIRTRAAEGGRPARTEIIAGLRLPADQVRIYAADITKTPDANTELTFERLFAFQAGLREGFQAQLTSLLYLASWKGFFVVTATEDDDNAFHGNTLWFLPDDQVPEKGLANPQRVWDFEVAMKAEGLADLPDPAGNAAKSVRMVVTYDNDAHKTHMPSRIQTFRLIRGQ